MTSNSYVGEIPRGERHAQAFPVLSAAQIDLDAEAFVLTGAASSAGFHETSLPGIFAVGDARSGSIKRVASAVGKGSACIQQVHRVLALEAVEAASAGA
jgi:thioredoxin reductase (NADPH)